MVILGDTARLLFLRSPSLLHLAPPAWWPKQQMGLSPCWGARRLCLFLSGRPCTRLGPPELHTQAGSEVLGSGLSTRGWGDRTLAVLHTQCHSRVPPDSAS